MKFLFFNIVKVKSVMLNIFVSLDAYYFFIKYYIWLMLNKICLSRKALI